LRRAPSESRISEASLLAVVSAPEIRHRFAGNGMSGVSRYNYAVAFLASFAVRKSGKHGGGLLSCGAPLI